MVRFLFVLVLSFACSRVSDGQPLGNHRISLEAAQMEQRILASIRSILPQLINSDTCGSEKQNSEYLSALEDKIKLLRLEGQADLSALEDKIKNQTTQLGSLKAQNDKQQMDKCKLLFEKVDPSATVHVFEDRCYLFLTEQFLAWSNAQERCQLVGANLVSVMSQDMQDFVNSAKVSGYGWWIGGKRRTTDNKLAWIGNGLLLDDTYTNWYPGEPDSSGDCVYNTVNGWFDFRCSAYGVYICEL